LGGGGGAHGSTVTSRRGAVTGGDSFQAQARSRRAPALVEPFPEDLVEPFPEGGWCGG
jgi:hypothetical protein